MFSMKTSPPVQVYLVAGGWTGSSTLASTELLVEGAPSWTKAAPLPRALQGLDIVSINNQVILTGESNTILSTFTAAQSLNSRRIRWLCLW